MCHETLISVLVGAAIGVILCAIVMMGISWAGNSMGTSSSEIFFWLAPVPVLFGEVIGG